MKKLLLTGTALLGLWALSFGLSYASLGAVSLPVALIIAVLKATLVALFFMELIHARSSVKLAFVTALTLTTILLTLTVADVATR